MLRGALDAAQQAALRLSEAPAHEHLRRSAQQELRAAEAKLRGDEAAESARRVEASATERALASPVGQVVCTCDSNSRVIA